MKPKELPRTSPVNSCFAVHHHKLPHFLNVWHYHKEYELVYIEKSKGTKFIGDSMVRFRPGDLVLIGSWLPHLWLNDKIYFERKDKQAEACVIHFDADCFGTEFFNIPDLYVIRQLLEEAKVGLKVLGTYKPQILEILMNIFHQEGLEKVTSLLNMLHLIARSPNKPLSSLSFVNTYPKTHSKLDKVYAYMLKNFSSGIGLNDVADHVSMNPSAFSRFFKKATNKSFISFLIELRIGFACKIMLEDDYKTIAEVCYESGFNNLSNFNKQFKKITGKTPMEYVQSHHHNIMNPAEVESYL